MALSFNENEIIESKSLKLYLFLNKIIWQNIKRIIKWGNSFATMCTLSINFLDR